MSITPDPEDYEAQQAENAKQAVAMFKVLFPQFPVLAVPMDEVIKIMMYLEETSVNPEILPRVIRGIYNIHLGSGEGDVIIHVRKNVTTMETREREEGQFETKRK